MTFFCITNERAFTKREGESKGGRERERDIDREREKNRSEAHSSPHGLVSDRTRI